MALSPQFLDDLKHRFTLSDVVGKTVRLVRRGREHTGLCPFHNEKSPSFTVNDQKGFYHCFGCGAHGSVIDFVMNTQGLEFMEAINMLAGEAGVEVPRLTPEQMERSKEQASLSEVMQTVADWYATQLQGAVGKAALAYVKGRGLTDATIRRYGLGYAPEGRTSLKEAMRSRGIGEDQLIETGMLIVPEGGGESYDRFRDRVMFPIGDRQGRIIAFGGRAMQKDAKAKYLNSPETTLFHKGATLYNWANARAAAHKSGQVIVVEGYMDVIALGQAGMDEAVAPLGTALTEEQISHLWHMADEPVLAFDGDKAGFRAAERAMERALPLLRPGKSLRFVMLPEGEDPDTLVQKEGRQAMERLIDNAEPLVSLLWRTMTQGVPADTPERRAGLEKDIFVRLAEIADENVKTLYQKDFRNRLYEKFRPQRPERQPYAGGGAGKPGFGGTGRKGFLRVPASTGLLSRTRIGAGRGAGPVTDRLEKILLLTLVNHPELLVRYEEDVAHLEFSVPGLDVVRGLLLDMAASGAPLDRETVTSHLSGREEARVVQSLMGEAGLKSDWFAFDAAALSDAQTGFEHSLSRYRHITVAWSDYRQAEADYAADMTDENHRRFVAAQETFRSLEEREASIAGYGLESNKVRTL